MARLLALAAAAGVAAARPAYSGSPVAINTTTYQTEIAPGVFVSADWDLVTIRWDSYGVPWNSFISSAPLPSWWEDRLNRTIELALATRLPIMLELSHGGGALRTCPAQNATDAGVSDVLVCSSCFDYNVVTNPLAAFFRAGFSNFALFMIARFNPFAFSYGIDFNRAVEACPERWGDMVDFGNQVYSSVKNFNSKLPVFVTLSHESIMGVNAGQPCAGMGGKSATQPPMLDSCIGDGLALVTELKRDLFGVSLIPTTTQIGNGAWQLWYATCVWDKLAPEEVIVVSSVSYDTSSIVLNFANSTTPEADRRALSAQPVAVLPLGAPTPSPVCSPLTTATTTDATDFFGYLVDLASRGYNIAIASFYSVADILPADVMTSCPCKSGSPEGTQLCGYLTAFRSICQQVGLQPFQCEANVKTIGSLGVRDYAGGEKPDLFAAVQAARAAGTPEFLAAHTA